MSPLGDMGLSIDQICAKVLLFLVMCKLQDLKYSFI